jgi:hypothetical protein
MKQYIQAIFPAEFKRNPAFWRAFVLGLVMMALALLQLFQFEDFPAVIQSMGLPGGVASAFLLAALFPLLEIAGLPYLFSMRVSPPVRRVSRTACLTVGVLWLIVCLWTSVMMGTGADSGIFGATLSTTSGWWSVVLASLLLWSVYLTMRELPNRR